MTSAGAVAGAAAPATFRRGHRQVPTREDFIALLGEGLCDREIADRYGRGSGWAYYWRAKIFRLPAAYPDHCPQSVIIRRERAAKSLTELHAEFGNYRDIDDTDKERERRRARKPQHQTSITARMMGDPTPNAA